MRNLLFLLLLFLVACNGNCQSVSTPTDLQPIDTVIRTGADVLMDSSPLLDSLISSQQRVAIVANQASITMKGTHLVDTLMRCGVKVVKIMSPEHGFRGNAEAGAHIASGIDASTGLPVVSLYGKNKKPTAEQLSDVDLVFFDLQDVGCRFYTYISTLHYVMQACAEHQIPVVILDRPNPNDGYVDGPVLESAYSSFVGMHPVPIVYGMTIGEYGQMINGEGWLKTARPCPLRVIALENYYHGKNTVLPIAPSPNLQNAHAIALYPSLCLFEGTNISVGRGTDSPFEIIGAPRCTLRHFQFTPHAIPHVSDNPPFKGTLCYGLDLRQVEVPNKLNLSWLIEMYQTTPHESFFIKNNFFDKLAGNSTLRKQIQQGLSESDIRQSWEPQLSQFKQMRVQYLLYPDKAPQTR